MLLVNCQKETQSSESSLKTNMTLENPHFQQVNTSSNGGFSIVEKLYTLNNHQDGKQYTSEQMQLVQRILRTKVWVLKTSQVVLGENGSKRFDISMKGGEEIVENLEQNIRFLMEFEWMLIVV